MRIYSLEVFDDIITGTSAVWYSSNQFNATLGEADAFAVQACTSGVWGTSPTLTVQAEHSGDNQSWVAMGTAEISAQTMSNGASFVGARDGGTPAFQQFIRFKLTLGGMNPQARVKLYVTGRVLSGPA